MDFLGREVQEGGIGEGEEEEQETFFENDFFPYSLVFSDEDLKLLAAGDSPEAEENGESPKVGSHEAVPATASNHDNDQGSKSVKDTRYLPPKTPPNSAGESEEQKNRRRAAVAAASRVTRAKRKREREALHKRNKELELEREIYLSRIAQLQTEVQTFRDTGSTNLEMENKLLRVEIRKHKAFIRTIIDATRAVPRLTPEEQFRLLHKGTESAIGQIVGLMFTSMADSSWTWSTMDTLTHDGTYQKSRMAMQPLPLGCDAQKAKRINARIEMPLRPESVDELGGKIWKIWTTEELFLKSYAESVFEPNDVKVSVSEIETGFDKFRGEFGEDFRVFHYKEEFQEGEARIRDCITAISPHPSGGAVPRDAFGGIIETEMAYVDWDEDDGADLDTFYNGSFFPAELVLPPKDLDVIASTSLSLSDEDDEGSASFSSASLNRASDIKLEDLQGSQVGADALSTSGSERTTRPTNEKSSYEDSLAPADTSGATLATGDGKRRPAKKAENEKNRRRAVVAASSRATRAKRKREREELHKRNQILEQEREIYLTRIAQLQTEVQAFRDSGVVNLQKENELLRVEIRKHKAFLRTIVDATRAAPKLTAEEQYRLIHSGTASAVGQVVGLVFTSAADHTWKWSTLTIPSYDDSLVECKVGLQPLPLGCEVHAAKRGNYRIDMPWRPETPMQMKQKIWAAWSRPEISATLYSPLTRKVKVGISEVHTNFEDLKRPDDPEMRVFHYNEEGEHEPSRRRDYLYTISWRATKVFIPGKFPLPADMPVGEKNSGAKSEIKTEAGTADADSFTTKGTLRPSIDPFENVSVDDPDAALIVCSVTTSDDAGLQPSEEGVQRVSAPVIEGHVLRRGPDGKGCLWTLVHSVPLLDQGFNGVNTKDLLNDDLTIGPNGLELVASNILAINKVKI
ncbi:Hypothetical Protein FCC1311_003902 [Hondaea fermentalgiana]|uniref:BZIP domain-containing protein n=1 Tax=Hondaea fermentalgiana TaxID=2315210 RepID=A0A2R5FZJ3_9STRA|nr:Hypothetical Protein FCC1311_003902 [Hondaea fermentalgiana]|eukprot:GBG24172.1 Hypothetical Protein FCC1311_003902 [Hondaea fermentalgiana]